MTVGAYPSLIEQLVGKTVVSVTTVPTREGASIDLDGDFETIIKFDDGSTLTYMEHINMIRSKLVMGNGKIAWMKTAASQR